MGWMDLISDSLDNPAEVFGILNTLTNGMGWNVIVMAIGFAIGYGLRGQDFADNLIISGITMCLVASPLFFAGLVNGFAMSFFFVIWVFGMILKRFF